MRDMIMGEEEEQYRLMNEEEDFYIGNKEDNRENDNKKTSNIGCIGMLLLCCFLMVPLFV
jgi:hypothetical protein